jgi:hypothetical protein
VTAYLASDYWFESGVLHYVSANGQYKLLPLARLDLEETVKRNRERNVEFTMRSRDASQQLRGATWK